MNDPLQILARWLDEARDGEQPSSTAMTLATAGSDGRPSARVVSLKRLEAGALVFTTGLWTRKAEELCANPLVAALFYWPVLGRQVRVEGRAEAAERELAEELFTARPRGHQLQTLVSRQGETIEDIAGLRSQLDALKAETANRAIPCPVDWAAIRITPSTIEFWKEGADRLHDRLHFRATEDGWHLQRLAP